MGLRCHPILKDHMATKPNTAPTEHEEQRNFVAWFRKTYPSVRIMAIPNGGYRSKATAARLKLEGVESGVPDLFIPEWRMWIEMKRTVGGSTSAAQKDWLAHLASIGYTCHVCAGANKAMEVVRSHTEA